MKIDNLGKAALAGVGLSTAITKASPLEKRDYLVELHDDKGGYMKYMDKNSDSCVKIPQQVFESVTTGVSGILALAYRDLVYSDLPAREQQNIYDMQYNNTTMKNWNMFLEKETKKTINDKQWKKLNEDTLECLYSNIQLYDMKEIYRKNSDFYNVASYVETKDFSRKHSINRILPVNTPILPDIPTLNETLHDVNNTLISVPKDVYWGQTLFYLPINDYENCVDIKVDDFCKRKIKHDRIMDGIFVGCGFALATGGVLAAWIVKVRKEGGITRAIFFGK